jgi:hypothetical protein
VSDDVRTTDTDPSVERVQKQFAAWQSWQRALDHDPDDWQAFRRDMAVTGAAVPGGQTATALSSPDDVVSRASGDGKQLGRRIKDGGGSLAESQARRALDTPSGRAPAAARALQVDLLAAARARGEQMKRDILAAQGDLLDVVQVAACLRIASADVEVNYRRGLLVGLPLDEGVVGFPAWQFTEIGLLPGLEDVLRGLGVRNVWMRAAFFLSGDLRLDGRTPLEALLDGEIDAVRAAAAAYGDQLAS